MLFDLRGRGRRRTVQVIYVTLALLMGGGLVLFGIGGATSGGLFDALGGSNGGGGPSVSKQISQVEKRLKTNPADAPSWAQLARLRFQDASQTGYDQATSTFTDKGRQELAGVRTAWERYLALNPAKPDGDTALLMVQALGPSGLAANADAVKAMEIVLAQRPETSGLYVQYANLAYSAGQTRKGDLAAAKAVDLAPKDQRAALKDNLAAAKKALAAGANGTTTGTTTTG